MNPIPLTDPRGIVRAYACGSCGHAYSGGQIMGLRKPLNGGQIMSHAASADRRANACCRCLTCGASIAPRVCGDCPACAERARQDSRWFWWLVTWHDIGYLASRGIKHASEISEEDGELLDNWPPHGMGMR